jgi:hypothetical protein
MKSLLLFGVCVLAMLAPVAKAIEPVPQTAIGDTTITMNPSTPAPGEVFTLTIRGSWSDSCVPQLQNVMGAGNTITINALANSNCTLTCTTAVTSYSATTPGITINNPGIYTVEYYVTECNKARTLVQSTTITINGACQFDRSLTASSLAVRVGSSVLLRWCDPTFNPGPDQGYHVNFYRVLASRSANGPFVAIGDLQPTTGVGINFDANDVGPAFFFVEAHGCNVTIAGCTGDVVLRTNVVRVDVASASGCLQDANTLCLNNGRFQVTTRWRTADGNSGPGQAVSLTDNSGYFWFFSADNVELVVKALNACTQPAPRYWVFASGLTNVAVDITVTDTKSGQVKVYSNPLGHPFEPIQDTGAFATCP